MTQCSSARFLCFTLFYSNLHQDDNTGEVNLVLYRHTTLTTHSCYITHRGKGTRVTVPEKNIKQIFKHHGRGTYRCYWVGC